MLLIPHLVVQLLSLFVHVWWSWWCSLWAVILIWEQTQLINALTNWDVDCKQMHSQRSQIPKFSWGHPPRPPHKGLLHTTAHYVNFSVLCTDDQFLFSLHINAYACIIFGLTKAEVLLKLTRTIFGLTKAEVLLPHLTHSLPSPTDRHWAPCLKVAENLQQLPVSL